MFRKSKHLHNYAGPSKLENSDHDNITNNFRFNGEEFLSSDSLPSPKPRTPKKEGSS